MKIESMGHHGMEASIVLYHIHNGAKTTVFDQAQ